MVVQISTPRVLASHLSSISIPTAIHHASYPVWQLQVLNGCSLCQELRVGQDLKVDVGVRAVAFQHLTQAVRKQWQHWQEKAGMDGILKVGAVVF